MAWWARPTTTPDCRWGISRRAIMAERPAIRGRRRCRASPRCGRTRPSASPRGSSRHFSAPNSRCRSRVRGRRRAARGGAAGGSPCSQQVSSASCMWTANAATISPRPTPETARRHPGPRGRGSTGRSNRPRPAPLKRVFPDPAIFRHHALPPCDQYGDEAANHTRLATESGVVHLFVTASNIGPTDFDHPDSPPARPGRREASRGDTASPIRCSSSSRPARSTWACSTTTSSASGPAVCFSSTSTPSSTPPPSSTSSDAGSAPPSTRWW